MEVITENGKLTAQLIGQKNEKAQGGYTPKNMNRRDAHMQEKKTSLNTTYRSFLKKNAPTEVTSSGKLLVNERHTEYTYWWSCSKLRRGG